MFHAMFLVMQKDLNFTATLHKRKDGKWGPTLVLPNGTIEAHGIISSLTTGYAEMIVTRYVFFILKRLHKCRIECIKDWLGKKGTIYFSILQKVWKISRVYALV